MRMPGVVAAVGAAITANLVILEQNHGGGSANGGSHDAQSGCNHQWACRIISEPSREGGMALTVAAAAAAAAAAFALKARVFDTPRAKFGRRFYQTWYRWAVKTRAFYRLGY
jgi:hypothetical protein